MKFKKRKEKILYDDKWNFIGQIKVINDHPSVFYEKTSDFFGKNPQLSNANNVKKIDRFIKLLKITNVFIDDDGNIKNPQYFCLSKKIVQEKKALPCQINRIETLISEIKLILQIKDILHVSRLSNILDRKFVRQYFANVDYETNVKYISDFIRKVNKFSLFRLNQIHLNKKFIKDEQFKKIVELWKYGNASLIKKNNRIKVCAATEVLKGYLATMQLNENIRHENTLLHISDDIDNLDKYVLQDLIKIFYIDISPRMETYSNYSEEDKKKIQELIHKKLFGIELFKWIRYICDLQIQVIKEYKNTNTNKKFIKIPVLKNVLWTSKEQQKMIQKLSFTKKCRPTIDLLDKPIIYGEYLYLPSIIHADPTYIISNLMREDTEKQIKINGKYKTWQDFIGYSFENYCYKIFKQENYLCQHTVAVKSKVHETDLLIVDKDSIPCLVECKTFTNPHSLKDYVIQIDKMYSSGYLKHDSGHINYFKELGMENPKNFVFKEKLRGLENWDKSYGIFLSNIIFPSDYCQLWTKETTLKFIYEIDLYKLMKGLYFINDRLLLESLVSIKIGFVCLNKNLLPIIEARIDNFYPDQKGLDKHNICQISDKCPALNLELKENVSSIFKDFKKNRKNSLDTLYCIEKSIFYLPDDLELEEWRSVLF